MPPRRQRYPYQIVLDGSGGGFVTHVARGDFLVQTTRLVVSLSSGASPAKQSTAMLTLNGAQFEGSYSGNNDTSDTQHLMMAGDELVCTWTGGDAGATATLTLFGVQFDAGEGMAAIYGGRR